MQMYDFTFSGLCSYVLYWAKEEGKTANTGLYESNQLETADCKRISNILHKTIKEDRLSCEIDCFADDIQFVKTKE